VPCPFQIQRDEAVQHGTLPIVDEPLVAQPGRYASEAQQRSQQVRLGDAQTYSFAKHVECGHRHARVLRVARVEDVVAHMLE